MSLLVDRGSRAEPAYSAEGAAVPAMRAYASVSHPTATAVASELVDGAMAVILAGGGGTRLWPLTAGVPKGAVRLAARSLVDRVLDALPPALSMEQLVVCASAPILDALGGASLRVAGGVWIPEPTPRGTAAAMVLVSSTVLRRYGDVPLLILPCDCYMPDLELARGAMTRALALASRGHLVSLCVPATVPDPDLGYVECSAQLEDGSYPGLAYVEKPSLASAEVLVASQRYAWNAGMFAWTPAAFLDAVRCTTGDAFVPLIDAIAAGRDAGSCYDLVPNISVDHAVMQRLVQVGKQYRVVMAPMRWRDIGTLDALTTAAHELGGSGPFAEHPLELTIDPGVEGRATKLGAALSAQGDLVLYSHRAALESAKNLFLALPSEPLPACGGALRRVVLAGCAWADVESRGSNVRVRAWTEPCPQQRTLYASVEPEQASLAAGAFVVDRLLKQLATRERVAVVLSAGRSPRDLYRWLVKERRSAVPWERVDVFQMDELASPGGESCGTLAAFIEDNVVGPLGIASFTRLRSLADVETIEAQLIARGGADLIVHGIGTNGHIGFVEPGGDVEKRRGLVDLAASTRDALRSFLAAQDPPEHGLTLGLNALTSAKSVLLLAFGPAKHAALRQALGCAASGDVPAARLARASDLLVACDLDAFLSGELASCG